MLRSAAAPIARIAAAAVRAPVAARASPAPLLQSAARPRMQCSHAAFRSRLAASRAAAFSSAAAAAPPAAAASPAPSSPPTLASFFTLPAAASSPRIAALLHGYTHAVPILPAWGEQDGFGHVNNAVYIRWLETARIHWLSQLAVASGGNSQAQLEAACREFMSASSVGPILRSVYCSYQSPVTHPDCVLAASRVHWLSSDRFSLTHRLVSVAQQKVVAEGEGIIVAYDYRTRAKADVPAIIRQAIEARIAEQKIADAKQPIIKPQRPSTNFQ